MTFFNKDGGKSNIIDYVLPCILIALAMFVSWYLLNSSNQLKSDDSSKINQTFIDPSDNSMINKYSDINMGLYKSPDGFLYLYTVSGNKIFIPQNIQNEVKTSVIDFIIANQAGLNSAKEKKLNIINDPISSEYFTRQYSTVIETISGLYKESVNKSMYHTLAQYGLKLSELEAKLAVMRDSIFEAMINYEADKLYYQQSSLRWKQIWIQYFKCLKYPDDKECPVRYIDMSNTFTELNDAYIRYRESASIYKERSEEIIPEAMSCYEDLKNNTGKNFDLLLDTINQYDIVQQDIKHLIVSLGEEIKTIKNSIILEKISVMELTAFIEINNPNIREEIDYFESIDITINNMNSTNVDCITNCIIKGGTNCSAICNKQQ